VLKLYFTIFNDRNSKLRSSRRYALERKRKESKLEREERKKTFNDSVLHYFAYSFLFFQNFKYTAPGGP